MAWKCWGWRNTKSLNGVTSPLIRYQLPAGAGACLRRHADPIPRPLEWWFEKATRVEENNPRGRGIGKQPRQRLKIIADVGGLSRPRRNWLTSCRLGINCQFRDSKLFAHLPCRNQEQTSNPMHREILLTRQRHTTPLVGEPHHPGEALRFNRTAQPNQNLEITGSSDEPSTPECISGGMDAKRSQWSCAVAGYSSPAWDWSLAPVWPLGYGLVFGIFNCDAHPFSMVLNKVRYDYETGLIVHDAIQQSNQDFESSR